MPYYLVTTPCQEVDPPPKGGTIPDLGPDKNPGSVIKTMTQTRTTLKNIKLIGGIKIGGDETEDSKVIISNKFEWRAKASNSNHYFCCVSPDGFAPQ